MRSYLSLFLLLLSALRVDAVENPHLEDLENRHLEDLSCLDTESGESAQSLLSSGINVQFKYRKPRSQDAKNSTEILNGHVSDTAMRRINVSSPVVLTHQNSNLSTLQHQSGFTADYAEDGLGDRVRKALMTYAGFVGSPPAVVPQPVDLHTENVGTTNKGDTATAAVVAAAVAEVNGKDHPDQKPPGWKPPAPRAGGEQPEVQAVEDTGPTTIPPHPEPKDSKSEDSEQIWAILGKMHMSFWMDVLLLFLFFGCCCCCLREVCIGVKSTQDDTHMKERQIVSYDADRLVHLSILMRLFARGSLCAKGKVWSQMLFFFILWIVLTMVLLSTVKYASKLDDKSIRTLSSYLNSFMPFFFAMYLNVVFGRWWTMRTAGLGAMWQAVDDMCVILASHCPGEQFEQQRSTLLRYGLLCQALIYQVARKKLDLDQLVEDKILMPVERKALDEAPGSPPQTIWVWILDLWKQLHNDGHVEWWVVQHAQRLASDGRRAVKTIFTYVTCQIPFGWVHLMTFMVNITIIILVLKAAIITAKDVADMSFGKNPCTMDIRQGFSCDSDFHDQVSIFSQVIQLIIVPFLFLAFLEFTNELTNPFGEDPHDFPRHVYMLGMRNENLGFFHVAGKGTGEGAPPGALDLK